MSTKPPAPSLRYTPDTLLVPLLPARTRPRSPSLSQSPQAVEPSNTPSRAAPISSNWLRVTSTSLEKGEPLKSCNALEAWKRNQSQLSIISAGFLIIMQLWIASNYVLFALLYTGISPPLDNFFANAFLSEEGRAFAFASFAVGFMFAWIAFVISVVVCFGFLLAGFPLVLDMFSGWAPQVVVDGIASLSFLTHFSDISRGVIDLRDLIYFALVISAFLYANTIVLRWKQARGRSVTCGFTILSGTRERD